jgi:hypothetical protein
MRKIVGSTARQVNGVLWRGSILNEPLLIPQQCRLPDPSKLGGAKTKMKARVERSRTVISIRCDHHPGFQQIAFVDTVTEDYREQRLEHSEGAGKFYRARCPGQEGTSGNEASGKARWFERLLRR